MAAGAGAPSSEAIPKVRAAVHTAVVGRDEAVDQILIGILADGHLLLEDLPGLGKTLIAKSFAAALGLSFQRIQFTSDLLPHDILGTEIFDVAHGTFVFRPGPVFANILLADEINRAPPKVQSALLEAMQEYQVTSERTTHPLERPFLVLATQNPLELEGTYPLPEAQIDRFLLRVSVGYPTPKEEREILRRRAERKQDAAPVPTVLAPGEFLRMQRAVEEVELDASVEGYLVDLVRATRTDPRAEVGASPRGSLGLARAARAHALVDGRDFVLPDDVKAIAGPALAHRITVLPEPWIRGTRGIDIVRSALEHTAVPKTR
ncbi:MAG: MoxR family ATPase [Candidatus Thermoplasmatota archaeon]|jgi:MoxR-like ATPase|nr:MoxR family ATPase [Candidatus Thermoplasmatota archaeon]MCL5983111.1 MoxR family ATPase [Candidatus Thermoplasmatota archaeon]